MSASTRSVPAQVGLGRFPSTLAALALVVILAVAVAIVALNGAKAAPIASGAKGAPPPAVIDHGWSNGETVIVPSNVTYYGGWNVPSTVKQFGGWGGPRLAPAITPALKGPVYLGDPNPYTTGAPRGLGLRAQ